METHLPRAVGARPGLETGHASPFEQLLDFVAERFHAQHPDWKMLPFSLKRVQQTSGLANGLWTLELRARERRAVGTPRVETFSAVHVPFGDNPIYFSIKKPSMQRPAS